MNENEDAVDWLRLIRINLLMCTIIVGVLVVYVFLPMLAPIILLKIVQRISGGRIKIRPIDYSS
jgi:hypothetical protein